MKMVVAVSGGVDSSVAAARMVDAGYEVTAVHLALARRSPEEAALNSGCGSATDVRDAGKVAEHLGIPYEVWDLGDDFEDAVVDYFVSEYAVGRTPNPCLRCNEKIKFAGLLDRALARGFDAVATGHYARIVIGGDGTRQLHRAVDHTKDQSYVLGVLSPDQLARAYFPLGDLTKTQVRQEAADRGFDTAAKPDSTDICFIPKGDARAWLGERIERLPGDILDERGVVVGQHDGAVGYTIGQRRGLHLKRPSADGAPRYVTGVDPSTNTVRVGPVDELLVNEMICARARWCAQPPDEGAQLAVQVRAHGHEVPVTLSYEGGAEGTHRLVLHEPIRGVAAGQGAVLYEGTRVVGSATIDQAR